MLKSERRLRGTFPRVEPSHLRCGIPPLADTRAGSSGLFLTCQRNLTPRLKECASKQGTSLEKRGNTTLVDHGGLLRRGSPRGESG